MRQPFLLQLPRQWFERSEPSGEDSEYEDVRICPNELHLHDLREMECAPICFRCDPRCTLMSR
jgi:hypothetical protein